MPDQIIVPILGESITEATVSKWLKQVGDSVNSDEPLVELETDKVNVEVPSPLSGILSSIKVKEGDTVEVGALLGIVNEGAVNANITKRDNGKKKTYEPPKKTTEEPVAQKVSIKEEKPIKLVNVSKQKLEKPLVLKTLVEDEQEPTDNKLEQVVNVPQQKYIPPKSKKTFSPSVRKIIKENKIDVSEIQGSGKDGRISKGDLLNIMGNNPQQSVRKNSYGPEERVKMTRLRVTIAKRLKEAQDSAAMLTTFNEVDMQSVVQMKQDYKEDFQKKYNAKLGFMSFFVKSCVVALKNFPSINAEIDGNEIIYKNYYNIGIAVGTEKGLVVPVLKNADELSFADIERNIFLLSEKAKKGKIVINDLQGGTFTISNGGIYGSMLSTPILNPPQTGILGMHNIIDRPVVKEGSITIRPIMYLALSYDHRIIDGKEAVSFLKTIKDCLEEPRRLFLDL